MSSILERQKGWSSNLNDASSNIRAIFEPTSEFLTKDLGIHKKSNQDSSNFTTTKGFQPSKISWWLQSIRLHEFFHHSAIISWITFNVWKFIDCYLLNKVYRGILRFLLVHRNSTFIERFKVLTETIVLLFWFDFLWISL